MGLTGTRRGICGLVWQSRGLPGLAYSCLSVLGLATFLGGLLLGFTGSPGGSHGGCLSGLDFFGVLGN